MAVKGKNDVGDYVVFEIAESENNKNILHPQTKWMVPKDENGVWISDFDLFNERLEEGFDKSVDLYINHGNEVNMQAAWLFNSSGKPWLTQKYTRAIMDSYYGSTPYHGWEGDEDEGQMGAWFVTAAMGLFEMNGAADEDPVLELSSPLFEEIVIHLDEEYYSGKTFVIRCENFGEGNVYIQSASLNGMAYHSTNIRFSDVVVGGELIYKMGSEENEEWGTGEVY